MELIDTLIKMALGASFGALAVYLPVKDRLNQQKLATTARRVALLEEVAQHLGKVSHCFSRYASLAGEIGPKLERMTPKNKAELQQISNELVAVYEEVAAAEAKLLLLGEKRLEKAMKLYTSKMAQYRKQIYPGRYSSVDEANKARQEIGAVRDQFYDILSERYDQQQRP